MGRNGRLLDRQEAAEILGVSYRQIQNDVQQGYLIPVVQKGFSTPQLFREEDVIAFKEVRKARYTLTEVTSFALQAHAAARSALRQLDEIRETLGLKIEVLKLDEASVVDLYFDAMAAVTETTNATADTIGYWAAKLLALDENFLRLTAEFTSSPEPWKPYFDLAERYATTVSMKNASEAKQAAYQRLLVARNNLRLVMYSYERGRSGRQVANSLFMPDIDEMILPYTQG